MSEKHADNVVEVKGKVQRIDIHWLNDQELVLLDVFNAPYLVVLSRQQYRDTPVLVGDEIEAWVVPDMNLTEDFVKRVSP